VAHDVLSGRPQDGGPACPGDRGQRWQGACAGGWVGGSHVPYVPHNNHTSTALLVDSLIISGAGVRVMSGLQSDWAYTALAPAGLYGGQWPLKLLLAQAVAVSFWAALACGICRPPYLRSYLLLHDIAQLWS
jgi:hypothetical protein